MYQIKILGLIILIFQTPFVLADTKFGVSAGIGGSESLEIDDKEKNSLDYSESALSTVLSGDYSLSGFVMLNQTYIFEIGGSYLDHKNTNKSDELNKLESSSVFGSFKLQFNWLQIGAGYESRYVKLTNEKDDSLGKYTKNFGLTFVEVGYMPIMKDEAFGVTIKHSTDSESIIQKTDIMLKVSKTF